MSEGADANLGGTSVIDPSTADLPELLRRCHRDELLPLATALGIRPDGMGLGTLADAIGRALRRMGANDVTNLLRRRGEGPPYAEVLRDLARRNDMPEGRTLEERELRLLVGFLIRAGTSAPEPLRSRLEAALPPELRPKALPARVEASVPVPVSIGLAVGTLPFLNVVRLLVLTPLGPGAGCLTLFWLARPKDDRLFPAVLEVARLRQSVLHRVTVGIVGSPSSGKDAGIKAIFGVDHGNVSPIAGSTKEVQITRLPGERPLYVVNTPGMGDVVAAVTEEARQVLGLIDVFVYVVNAQGGVQQRERDDHARCVASGRPVLVVVNKVDTLRPADRDRLVEDCRKKLGIREDEILAAAFDPLPALSETPIGIDPIRAWLKARLVEMGKKADELGWG